MAKFEVCFKYRNEFGREVTGRNQFTSYHDAVAAMSHLVKDMCYDIKLVRALTVDAGITQLQSMDYDTAWLR